MNCLRLKKNSHRFYRFAYHNVMEALINYRLYRQTKNSISQIERIYCFLYSLMKEAFSADKRKRESFRFPVSFPERYFLQFLHYSNHTFLPISAFSPGSFLSFTGGILCRLCRSVVKRERKSIILAIAVSVNKIELGNALSNCAVVVIDSYIVFPETGE